MALLAERLKRRNYFLLALILLLLGTSHALLSNGENKINNAGKTYTAHRLTTDPPIIDGCMDDTAWKETEWAADFVQKSPYEGKPPTENTAFKILYDQKNIYVCIRAFDTKADEILRQMSRRDNRVGDWVEVVFDSYYDQRTGFAFSVNAAGVKHDLLISGDGDSRDTSWDPTWEVKTTWDTEGWTAEMQIPLTQLRFGRKDHHTWGLQVTRFLHRTQETSEWKLIPRNASGWVSLFGELKGLEKLSPRRRFELLPYTVGRYETFEKEENDPFTNGRKSSLNGGLDGNIGITNDLTLDFTINPDFGQVEADPGDINLTAFETYFEEKRPFFIEGNNILNFLVTGGDGAIGKDTLFYSRRIGRDPHYTPEPGKYQYMDIPLKTTILAAFKLTGKTRNGLSIGILDSVTAREDAAVDAMGIHNHEAVEPLTNYFVLRLQKDYNRGNTVIGGMFTSTHRDIDDAQLNFLHRSAYTGGLDFTHSWKDKEWTVFGNVVFSNVNGDPEAIYRTQTAPQRYFQRPDADYVTLDPERTSLSGHGGMLGLQKMGGHWLLDTGVTWRSPGLELNDTGFLYSADRIFQWFWLGYRVTEPFSIFRQLDVGVNQFHEWNFGGENVWSGIILTMDTQLKNYWLLSASIWREFESLSATELRGGPALKKPGIWQFNIALQSDERKKLRFQLGADFYNGDYNSLDQTAAWFNILYRPVSTLSMSLQPCMEFNKQELQYIETLPVVDGTENRYIFGAIDQEIYALTLRLNYSITPDLSIQFYGQPYITSTDFNGFKYITNPRADAFNNRFHTYTTTEIAYAAEQNLYKIAEDNGKQYEFLNPDFDYLQFRSNLVLRWEYIPGSTLYLVWSHGRTGLRDIGEDFSLRQGMKHLFQLPPHDVFLIKFTYRFKL